jgi:hypothetical protein
MADSIGVGFGLALAMLKEGRRVYRMGWNGKGMWLVIAYQTANEFKKEKPIKFNKQYEDMDVLYLENFIAMKTVDGKLVPWLASQTDILAEDWCMID